MITNEKPYYLLTFSAKTKEALNKRISNLNDWLNVNKDITIDTLSYTLNKCRFHFLNRFALIADSMESVRKTLQECVNDKNKIEINIKHSDADQLNHKNVTNVIQELNENKFITGLDYKNKLLLLKNSYCQGSDINWEAFYYGVVIKPLSLPSYPFEKIKCWVENKKTQVLSDRNAISLKKQNNKINLSTPYLDNNNFNKTTIESTYSIPYIQDKICEILKTNLLIKNYIDINKSFIDLGLDSIVGVELIKNINTEFKTNLSVSALYDYPTISTLSQFIEKQNIGSVSIDIQSNLVQKEQQVYDVPLKIELNKFGAISNHIKKLIINKSGSIEDVNLIQAEVVNPLENEIQIKVRAATIVLPDLLCVTGLYPTMPSYPFTPGFEISGEVIKTGKKVKQFKIGDKVFGHTGQELGGQAEIVNVPAFSMMIKPDYLQHEEAVTLPIAFLTAYHAIHLADLAANETILINSAGSSTGLITVQLAKNMSAKIIAAVGSDEKVTYLKNIGIDHVVNYQNTDIAEYVNEITHGKGVDVVINMLSGEMLQKSLNLLAHGGRYVELATGALRAATHVDLSRFTSNQKFCSVDLRKIMSQIKEDSAIKNDYFKILIKMLNEKQILPIVDSVFGFEDYKKAYKRLQNRKNIGRIVLKVSEDFDSDLNNVHLSNINISASLLELNKEEAMHEQAKAEKSDQSNSFLYIKIIQDLKEIVRDNLYVKNVVDENKNFVEMGLDSILGVQLIKNINKKFNLNLSASLLYDYSSIDLLARFLSTQVKNVSDDKPAVMKSFPHTKIDKENKCVIITKSGNLKDVEIGYSPVADPEPNEVQVLVKASTVTLPDLLCVKGLYPTLPSYPFTPGFEFSGVIIKVGELVAHYHEGDEVFGFAGSRLGGQSTILNISEENIVIKPSHISHEEAASLPTAFVTANYAIELAQLKPGEKILIHTAASSVGLLTVQLANLKEAEIFATAGSKEKVKFLEGLNIKYVINYREEDFENKIKNITQNYGVDVVINMLSGEAIQKGLNLLSQNGRYIELAPAALRSAIHVDLSCFTNNQRFFSIDLRKQLLSNNKTFVNHYLKLLSTMLSQGVIKPAIYKTYSFNNVMQAYQDLEHRKNIGRSVLVMEEASNGKSFKKQDADKLHETDIAIIGYSGRFPGADSLEKYWENLQNGQSTVTEVPSTRWSIKDYFDEDPVKPNKTQSKWGGFLNNIEQFDAAFFGISPAEAIMMDPQQRLFLEEAWRTFESAGYSANQLAGKQCGVFVGVGYGDYIDYLRASGADSNAHALIGMCSSILASRISYHLDLKGPSISIDTACSSSLVAIHQACQSIRNGESEMALAGGVCILTTPALHIMTSKAMMLSKDGKCKTFDNAANGFVPGEGVGAILLKPLSKAIKDNDYIHAIIKGSGVNQDGKTNGITAPSVKSQIQLELDVYNHYNLNPKNISYVEAHGTGTKLGDPIEIEALNASFSKFTNLKQFCGIGSVKTNIGHSLSAAGIASVIKMILCLKHKKLVPTLNFSQENEHIDFKQTPFYVNLECKNWQSNSPLLTAVSSFGFSGTNAHVVIEENKVLNSDNQGAEKPYYLIAISAKSNVSLKQRCLDLEKWLHSQSPNLSLNTISYGLNVCRTHFNERYILLVKDSKELLLMLNKINNDEKISNFFCSQNVENFTEQASKLYLLNNLINDLTDFTSMQNDLYYLKLKELAQLYIEGYKIDWDMLYKGEKIKKINLPLYPFNTKRSWYERKKDVTFIPESSSKIKLIDLNKSEPSSEDKFLSENEIKLRLQHRVKNPLLFSFQLREMKNDTISFCAPISVEDNICIRDHIVYGVHTMPTDAYIEIIYLILMMTFKGDAYHLEKIQLINPLTIALNEKRNLIVVLKKVETYYQFGIFSQEFERDSSKLIHVKGVIEFNKHSFPQVNKEKLVMPGKSVLPDIIGNDKNSLWGGGFYRSIRTLTYNSKEAIANLVLSEDAKENNEQFVSNPSIIDGIFGVALAVAKTISKESSSIYLPVYIDLLELKLQLDDENYYVYLNVVSQNDFEIIFNLQLINSHQEVVGNLNNLKVGLISRDDFHKTERENVRVTKEKSISSQDKSIDKKHYDSTKLLVKTKLAEILLCDINEINDKVNFQDMGVDSILGVEFIRKIKESLNIELNAAIIYSVPTIEKLTAFLLEEMKDLPSAFEKKQNNSVIEHLEENHSLPINTKNTDIAIIGISARLPGASNVDIFWENIVNKVNSTGVVPRERWEADDFYDSNPNILNKTYSKVGGFIENVDKFDASFFGILPKEAELMDPQQRIFLEESWKAIEDAGYSENEIADLKCGVFVGASVGDYAELLSIVGLQNTAQAFTGLSPAILTGRISYLLNLKGPSIAIDTACSSSLVAVHQACSSILAGESDIALAGGVALMLTPQGHIKTAKAGMLSPSGVCSTFDKKADGIVIGEGVGVIVLKNLKNAMEDGDSIYGVIKGSGINQDGSTNGITAPNPDAQYDLLMEVYKKSGVNPSEISYIEAHGTGTPLGDPVEFFALTKAFSQFTNKVNYCAIGSIKPNIGHTSMTAGIAGLIKVLLALKHKKIPPLLNFSNINEHININQSPFYITSRTQEWKTTDAVRRIAAVSSFGFSGTNAHVLIEEAPTVGNKGFVTQKPQLITLSAKNKLALECLITAYKKFLENNNDLDITHLAYTTNIGRTHFDHRVALCAVSTKDFLNKLLNKSYAEGQVSLGDRPRITFRDDIYNSEKIEIFIEFADGVIKEIRGLQSINIYLQSLINKSHNKDSISDAWEYFLDSLGQLYVIGYQIDWKALHSVKKGNRLHLPTYTFDSVRHWVEGITPQKIKERILGETKHEKFFKTNLFHQIEWVEQSNKNKKLQTNKSDYLVLADDLSFGEELVLYLSKENTSGKYICNQISSPQSAMVQNAENIVFLLGINKIELDISQLDNFHQDCYKSIHSLITNLFEAPTSLPSIFFVTRGVHAISGSKVNLYGAFIIGLMRSLMLEYPQIKMKHLDLDPDATNIENFKSFQQELDCVEDQVAYRAAKRLMPRIMNLEDDAHCFTKFNANRNIVIDANGSYLITGGMGGVSVPIISWLISEGAQNIILIGRNPPKTEFLNKLNNFKNGKINILHFELDVKNEMKLYELLNKINSLHPLKGVIHAAGLLEEKEFLKESWDHFEEISSPKILGVLNLHKVLRELNLKIDFLILFSSISSIFGLQRQSSYTAANSFLDCCAHYLRESGFQAISINWGPWSQVGMAARFEEFQSEKGFKFINPQDCSNLMKIVLKANLSQIIVGELNKENFCKNNLILSNMVKEFVKENVAQNNEAILTDKLKAFETLHHRKIIQTHLRSLIANISGLGEDQFDDSQKFFDLGMDSMMLITLKNQIQVDIGNQIEISPSLGFDYPNINKLAEYLETILNLNKTVQTKELVSIEANNLNEPIAIIGIGCRFPGGANNPDLFWRLLKNNVDAITEVPKNRWDIDHYYSSDPEAPGKVSTRFGGFLSTPVDEFDASFFGISPREAEVMDPQQRLVLEVTQEALEEAGISFQKINGTRTGVYLGLAASDYSMMLLKQGEESINAYYGTGNAINAAAGRIAYTLGIQGPAISIDTACSSSLVSVHLACQSLRHGETEMAIAGGVNLIISPVPSINATKAKMLAKDGRCKAFDQSADGYGRGEGCGIVILKRLKDAIQDSDRILAIIKGTAVNQDGDSGGLTVPNSIAQQSLIQQALNDAAVSPNDIDYIEAHGTGTSLGDPIEFKALTSIFGGRNIPLILGTVKTNIGHTESASGIAGLIKTVLALQKEEIPSHLHFRKVNPLIELDKINARIPINVTDWKRSSFHVRRAGISSFGFSGTNAHVILEEAPSFERKHQEDNRSFHIITISAKNEDALTCYIKNYYEFLEKNSELDIRKLSYTTNVGREHFQYRVAIVTSNIDDLKNKLIKENNFYKGKCKNDIEIVIKLTLSQINNHSFFSMALQINNSEYRSSNLTEIVTQLKRIIQEYDFIDEMQSSNEEEQLFISLAILYVNGAAIDWETFHASNYKEKISIPTYPFQRKRYWSGAQAENIITKIDSNKHPLLARPILIPNLKEIIYESEISENWPSFVKDHTIYDRPLIAGATYVSTILSLLIELTKKDFFDLRQIEYYEPLILLSNQKRIVQTIIYPIYNNEWRFEILSRGQADSSIKWLLHAKGLAKDIPRINLNPIIETLDDIKKRCKEQYEDDTCYKKVNNFELKLGPQFQWIEKIWTNRKEALGLIRKSRDEDEENKYCLHPGFLDSCFQVLFLTMTDDEFSTLHLPLSIGKFVFDHRLGKPKWIHAIKTSENQNNETKSISFSFINNDGIKVGEVEGFVIKKAEKDKVLKNFMRSTDIKDWFYKIEWKNKDKSNVELNDTKPISGTWLLFSDINSFSVSLSAKMIRAGDDVISVTHGDQYLELANGIQLNTHHSEQINQLFSKISQMNVKGILYIPTFTKIDSTEALDVLQETSCKTFLSIIKALYDFNFSSIPTLWLITKAVYSIQNETPWGYCYATFTALPKILTMEYQQLKCINIDLDCEMTEADSIKSLWSELVNPENEEAVVIRGNARWVPRLIAANSSHLQELKIPEAEVYNLQKGNNGILDELHFQTNSHAMLGDYDVGIEVKAVGLNFRDVLNALNLYPGVAGPLGGDCSGIVTNIGNKVSNFKVGDEVWGIAFGCIGNYAVTHQDLISPKPIHISFAEGAGLPAAFLTAYYALKQIGEITNGKKVLIHTASGGVGLAAIQIAQLLGAEVFATAGSKIKRDYLKSIGINHVYDSRSLNFGAQIKDDTQGHGVDIVLNTLTGAGFIETSLSICSIKAKFIEISKRDIWTAEQISKIRSDVEYSLIALDELFINEKSLIKTLYQELQTLFMNKSLTPLPFQTFPMQQAIQAFEKLRGAKHIGKIVLTNEKKVVPQGNVNPLGTHLITGGLGGLGLVVSEWLLEKGAKNLLLVSRSKPLDKILQQINEFKIKYSAQIEIFQADISDINQTKNLFEFARNNMPALSGIMHAAGVLDDGLIINQTWEKFRRVLAPKVYGAYNLHKLTENIELDYFVMFSSIASLLGSPGQSNHASANAYLDALAHFRHSMNKPALSINWGAWSQVGVAKELNLENKAIDWIEPKKGLEALNKILFNENYTQIGVTPIDWSAYFLLLNKKPIWLDEIQSHNQERVDRNFNIPKIEDLLAGRDKNDYRQIINELLLNMLRQILKFDSNTIIDPKSNLFELGMDSLMALEFKNRLQYSLGTSHNLPASFLFDYSTLEALEVEISRLLSLTLDDIVLTPKPNNVIDNTELLIDKNLMLFNKYIKNVTSPTWGRQMAKSFGKNLLSFFCKTYITIETEGLENLPVQDSFIICPNHSSYLDGIVLSAAMKNIKQELIGMLAKDYFLDKDRQWLVSIISIFADFLPFERDLNGQALDENLKYISFCKNANKAIVIFPEGTRSKDGKLQKFKNAIGWFAGQSGLKVVPAYISGAYELMPRGAKIPKRGNIKVKFGKPLSFCQGKPVETKDEHYAYQKFTELLKSKIESLITDIQ